MDDAQSVSKPAPASIGFDVERVKAALEFRKKRKEVEQRSATLEDVLSELRTLNSVVNDRLRVYPTAVPS